MFRFSSLCSRPSLCESCSTSQILFAHSGPHPPNTMSCDPCLDFSSSFNPSNHRPTPLPLPLRPPPSLPIPLQLLQIQFYNLHLMFCPPSLSPSQEQALANCHSSQHPSPDSETSEPNVGQRILPLQVGGSSTNIGFYAFGVFVCL